MAHPDSLEAYVADLRAAIDATDDPLEQATRAAARTRAAIADGEWVEPAVHATDGNPHVLHVDESVGHPAPGFRVMCPTADSGERRGGATAHDHGPTWVAYANYRGRVKHTLYGWTREDGDQPRLAVTDQFTLEPGDVTVIMPGEIHATETVGTDRSWVLRIESQDAGRVVRHWYDVETQSVSLDA